MDIESVIEIFFIGNTFLLEMCGEKCILAGTAAVKRSLYDS